MNTERPTYGLPLGVQYLGGIIFIVLALYALFDAGSGFPNLIACIGLISVGIVMVLKGAIELFVFVFSFSARSLGRWFGRRAARARQTLRQ